MLDSGNALGKTPDENVAYAPEDTWTNSSEEQCSCAGTGKTVTCQ